MPGINFSNKFFCVLLVCLSGLFTTQTQAQIKVSVSSNPLSIRLLDADQRLILEFKDRIRIGQVTGSVPVEEKYWMRWSKPEKEVWQDATTVLSNTQNGTQTELTLAAEAQGPALVKIAIRSEENQAIKINITALNNAVNRVQAQIAATETERFFGMGMRFDSAEHKNKKVTVWAREVGKNLPGIAASKQQEGRDTTYFPVPFFLSSRSYGLLIDDTHYSEFDFQSTQADTVSILNYHAELPLMLFRGNDPLEIISRQTQFTGRLSHLPQPWVFGNWAAAIKNSDDAREVVKTLRENRIPVSALMIEDWWWVLGFPARPIWTVNRGNYPDYEKLLQQFKQQGLRNIGYFHAYLTTLSSTYLSADQNWVEADKKGIVTKTSDGKSYRIPFFIWKISQLDWTNPEASKWFKEKFFEPAANQYGVDGWMHDFGEYTPFDSVAHNGMSGAELHNLYPLLWAKQGRDFWQQQRPDNDYIFFTRSGYTGLQKYAPLYFTGDRNANYEPLSGLPGQIPALLSAGISGHPLGTMDIGAYNCEKTPPMGKELFMRWVEMGALTPVMRTHRGLYPLCNHWDFKRDEQTLRHYQDYARLHVSLFPYIYTLVAQAKNTGWPVMRHLFLHYPNDPETAQQNYEFLLGDRILVAPVIEANATQRTLHLPSGKWQHWWTHQVYEGPATITVPAALGQLPFFIQQAKVIPFFDSVIDTLVPVKDPVLAGWESANASMKFLFSGYGEDDYTLWDGTKISCKRALGQPGQCEVKQSNTKRRYQFEFRE